MSMTNHPCDRYSCCENVGGQCFGGGCRYSPAPYAVPNDDDEEESAEEQEDEINDEWFGEEER